MSERCGNGNNDTAKLLGRKSGEKSKHLKKKNNNNNASKSNSGIDPLLWFLESFVTQDLRAAEAQLSSSREVFAPPPV